MKKIRVNSRIIKLVYYDPGRELLRVCFRNGEERLLSGVPESEVDNLVHAASPGNYYIERLSNRFPSAA